MLPPAGWWLDAGLYRSALISEMAETRLPQDHWQSRASSPCAPVFPTAY
jgi:hypothetical protein